MPRDEDGGTAAGGERWEAEMGLAILLWQLSLVLDALEENSVKQKGAKVEL